MGWKQVIASVVLLANHVTKALLLLCNLRFKLPPNHYFWIWGQFTEAPPLLSWQLANVNNVFSQIRQMPNWSVATPTSSPSCWMKWIDYLLLFIELWIWFFFFQVKVVIYVTKYAGDLSLEITLSMTYPNIPSDSR